MGCDGSDEDAGSPIDMIGMTVSLHKIATISHLTGLNAVRTIDHVTYTCFRPNHELTFGNIIQPVQKISQTTS